MSTINGSGLTPFSTVLQMQGGSFQKIVGSVFAEKLPIIKALQGGNLGSLLGGLTGAGGLSSIMGGNPIADAMGNLQGSLGNLIAQVSSFTSSSSGSGGSSGGS